MQVYALEISMHSSATLLFMAVAVMQRFKIYSKAMLYGN